MKLFGVDVAKEVAKAIRPSDVPSITLRQYAAGVRDPLNLSGGLNRSYTDYVSRGVVSDYTEREIADATSVAAGDKRVLILAQPLGDAVPRKDDELVTPDGTLRIVRVERDPASASYECQCRG